jgi:hypothetical protein
LKAGVAYGGRTVGLSFGISAHFDELAHCGSGKSVVSDNIVDTLGLAARRGVDMAVSGFAVGAVGVFWAAVAVIDIREHIVFG